MLITSKALLQIKDKLCNFDNRDYHNNILLLILAYLLGALPFSILAGKLLKGIDIREHGSGNAGATNTFRVLGKKAGIPVYFLMF